ncbi:MAG: thiamine biosynthesis protein ThiS [Gammaproteobacteria bacterium HGW-Gammaproteobacteria-1]|jgi:thiamine biosynthesis protein ThiS|nr:MAG: thiamine biosynthesis protein ThiS [Gammaproteobacteria bacterium HGW-Gammaproteobacteria-1]
MQILVNGSAREVPDNYTAAELVEAMDLAGKRIAMEVNLEIVPRSSYAAHCFQPGDRIEVVQAIGGG